MAMNWPERGTAKFLVAVPLLLLALVEPCRGLVASTGSTHLFQAREGTIHLRGSSLAESRGRQEASSALSLQRRTLSSCSEWIRGRGGSFLAGQAQRLAQISSFTFSVLGSPGRCLAGIAAASLCRFAMCKVEELKRETERQRYLSMPSVVGWNQHRVFMQSGERTPVLEAAMGDGTMLASIGLNETEFRLLFELLDSGNGNGEESSSSSSSKGDSSARNKELFEVTGRHVDLSTHHVKVEMAQLWHSGRLAVKNKSLKNVLDPSPSLRKEVTSYMRRRRELDEEEEMRGDKLLEWLKNAYGEDKTPSLIYDGARNVSETSMVLKPLLEWFRERYPYYHQKCTSCGCDETAVLGTMRAGPSVGGKAGRVEYFYCAACEKHTVFARYNSLSHIVEEGRGRCGEYAAVWYAIMQSLGYQSRWVVDWTDHVWVEINVQGDWVHMDPCEAAFADKMMYAGWGKKHTFVVAFDKNQGAQDVTSDYCDDVEAAQSRRSISQEEFEAELEWARANLHIEPAETTKSPGSA